METILRTRAAPIVDPDVTVRPQSLRSADRLTGTDAGARSHPAGADHKCAALVTPRTDWPIYTIEAGDTLYSIALRTESTVDTIQAANCLANPNVIAVGQELRVPKVPPPPTPASAEAPVATPSTSTFFATPAVVGDVTFTIVIASNSASVTGEHTYRAQAPDGVVYLSIVTGNATSYTVMRSDGQQLGPVVLATAGQSAGNTLAFNRLDRQAGSDSLIFTIVAVKSDGTTVTSQPIFVMWP